MRWLMIALLVSVAVLLVAVAGAARHILRHRRRLQATPGADAASARRPTGMAPLEPPEEADQEL